LSAGTPLESGPRFKRIVASPERVSEWLGGADSATAIEQIVESLHPKQRAFALDPALRIMALVGRGGGKTTGGRARYLLKGLTVRRARMLYIATTRPQAEEFMWTPLKDLDEKLGLGCHFSETKLRMTFPQTGATLRLVGADDRREIEKLRGQPFHEVQVDEGASHKPQILSYLIRRIIGPRLGDFGGSLVIYGTPSHVLGGIFYEGTRNGSETARWYDDRHKPEFKDWIGWSSHRWTIQDGAKTIAAMARLWAAALVEKAREGWTDDNPIWRREYLGIWAHDDTESIYRYRAHTDEGEQWNQWDPERDKETGFVKLEGEHNFVYGLDMGHSDPFSLQILANPEASRELLHVFEFCKPGMYAKPIAELLVGKVWVKNILAGKDPGPAGGLIGLTGWPYGMVADVAGLGGAILDELSEVYGIPIEPAEKKHKFDSIELSNGDFIDGRISILKDSTLEDQLLNLQWERDDYGGLKERRGDRNDATDAFVYARRKAMHLIAGEQPPPEKPQPGSAEAAQAWLDADEEELSRTRSEDEDLLADGNYDEHYY